MVKIANAHSAAIVHILQVYGINGIALCDLIIEVYSRPGRRHGNKKCPGGGFAGNHQQQRYEKKKQLLHLCDFRGQIIRNYRIIL
jgi:hypothetical protein